LTLISTIGNESFINACQDLGDDILRFLGPELTSTSNNATKAVKLVGPYVAIALWKIILHEAQINLY